MTATEPVDPTNAVAWWSEHGRQGQEWYCEAVAVGMERDAGVCSPEHRTHKYPCGWR